MVARKIRLKCPVCAAGFRGVEICPRCGTDLGHVMRIAARAWALRQKSRANFAQAICRRPWPIPRRRGGFKSTEFP